MQFEWIGFYTELATKLLAFQGNRKALLNKIKAVYHAAQLRLPRLDSGDGAIDIDPFTVFGLFNKGITNANRSLLLEKIRGEFGVDAAVPQDFDGVPVLNNLSATFYRFQEERQEPDIENLWALFRAALALAEQDTKETREDFSRFYDRVHDQVGIRWNITMGLYWVRPYDFLSLDSRNRWYMTLPGKMPDELAARFKTELGKLPDSKEYLLLRDECKAALETGKYEYKSFPELSYQAWVVSEKVNRENAVRGNAEKGKALADDDVRPTHYWLYAPGDGAGKWDEFRAAGIMAIGWGEIGDLRAFGSKGDMKLKMQAVYDPNVSYKNAAYATWQFVNEMQPGDVVFVKKGRRQLVGKGVVLSDYEYDAKRPDMYCNVRRMNWTHSGEWELAEPTVVKTLTDVTAYTEFVEKLKALFEDEKEEEPEEEARSYPVYTAEDFLNEVYMPEQDYTRLVGILKHKKNIILQGAPGVGKTFAAKRLAYSVMGVKDYDRVMMVQFHQSYSYEDFIMGFRPVENGFALKKGVFYNFCKKAEIDTGNDYFFIIDEINRGNLSKIFGELFMLLESDKRDIPLQLLYADEKFAVPGNVYLIGTMNTADRSLAMLDYALRRRFAFFEMKPGFDTDGFREYRMNLHNERFDRLLHCVEALNQAIAADDSLGEGFCIGHSYFCDFKADTLDEQRLSEIVEFELLPLLKEYWFDEPQKVRDWSENLRSAIK